MTHLYHPVLCIGPIGKFFVINLKQLISLGEKISLLILWDSNGKEQTYQHVLKFAHQNFLLFALWHLKSTNIINLQ